MNLKQKWNDLDDNKKTGIMVFLGLVILMVIIGFG